MSRAESKLDFHTISVDDHDEREADEEDAMLPQMAESHSHSAFPSGSRAAGHRTVSSTDDAIEKSQALAPPSMPPRRRSLGSLRKSISRASVPTAPTPPQVVPAPVIHLADLGKRHTGESKIESEKLRKAVLKGVKGSHSQQPSMSSRPSSDTNHQPMWLTSNVWVNEINAIDTDMLELEKQYKLGELRAFGRNAKETFAQLDLLRHDQQELFQKHIEIEKSILAEIGHEVPEVEVMESEGFEPLGNEDSVTQTKELLGDMTVLCSKIQNTVFDHSGQAPSAKMPGATLPNRAKTPLTKEALAKHSSQQKD